MESDRVSTEYHGEPQATDRRSKTKRINVFYTVRR